MCLCTPNLDSRNAEICAHRLGYHRSGLCRRQACSPGPTPAWSLSTLLCRWWFFRECKHPLAHLADMPQRNELPGRGRGTASAAGQKTTQRNLGLAVGQNWL